MVEDEFNSCSMTCLGSRVTYTVFFGGFFTHFALEDKSTVQYSLKHSTAARGVFIKAMVYILGTLIIIQHNLFLWWRSLDLSDRDGARVIDAYLLSCTRGMG